MGTVNKLCIKGIVRNEATLVELPNGEGAVYEFTLGTQRMSGTWDELIVQCDVETLIGSPVKVEVGETITIYGETRIYKDHNNGMKSTMCAFATTITDENDSEKPFIDMVRFEGKLVMAPILRKTLAGNKVVEFKIRHKANKRKYAVTCVAWNSCADFIAKYAKGDRVLVEGRLQSREYYKKQDDGTYEIVTIYELAVHHIWEA